MCETPAALEPPRPRRAVHFDPLPIAAIPAPPVVPVDIPESKGFLSCFGVKGWIGTIMSLVAIAALVGAALYVRKHFVRPLIFGAGQKSATLLPQNPTPPLIPAFAKRRVSFDAPSVPIPQKVRTPGPTPRARSGAGGVTAAAPLRPAQRPSRRQELQEEEEEPPAQRRVEPPPPEAPQAEESDEGEMSDPNFEPL